MKLPDANLLLYAADTEAPRHSSARAWLESVLSGTERPVAVAGNLTGDAHLAALAIEHGADICSSDTEFGRFKGLRWTDPVS